MKSKINRFLESKGFTVFLCFITVMVSLGFASSTRTLFPDEMAKDLGVSRSLVSIGDSCRFIATAVINIFFGMLIERFGAKKLICAGFLTLTASMLMYASANHLVILYLAGTLLGIGFSWTSTAMAGYVIGRLCAKNKGTIMGLVFASNGVGGAIAIRLVGALIDPAVVGSYRKAYLFIACVLAVTGILMLLLFRDKKDADLLVTRSPKETEREEDGAPFSQIVKKAYFWCLLVCVFLAGVILDGSYGIVAMHYKTVDIDYGQITLFLSIASALLGVAKFSVGFLYDRLGLRAIVIFCIAFSVVSNLLLALNNGGANGSWLALIYAVVSPFALPLLTVMIPLYSLDLFGKRAYTRVMGIFVSANTAGYATGAFFMNLCFDIYGSYYYALMLSCFILLVMLFVLQYVISAARKAKTQPC